MLACIGLCRQRLIGADDACSFVFFTCFRVEFLLLNIPTCTKFVRLCFCLHFRAYIVFRLHSFCVYCFDCCFTRNKRIGLMIGLW